MTEQQFIADSRAVAVAVLRTCEARQLSRDDAAALTSCAFMEALGQILGPLGAVERMRDIADIAERQLLNATH